MTRCKRKEVGEHRAKIPNCIRVIEGLTAVILSKVEMIGHFGITVHEMICHLHNCGKDIESCNKAAMLEERDCPWDPRKHVVIYFNHVKQIIKQLALVNIFSDNNNCCD